MEDWECVGDVAQGAGFDEEDAARRGEGLVHVRRDYIG